MFLFNLSVPSIIYEMTQGLRHIQGRRHNNLEAGRNFFLLLWNSFFLFPQFHPSSSSIFNHFLFFLFCSSWGIQLSGGHSVSASESQLNNQSLDLSLFQHCRSAASQGKNGRRQADGDQTKKMQKKMRNVEQKGGTNWKLLPLRACKTKVALTVPNYPIFLSFFHLFEGKTAFHYTAPLSLKFERKVAAAINLNSKKKMRSVWKHLFDRRGTNAHGTKKNPTEHFKFGRLPNCEMHGRVFGTSAWSLIFF